jgi:TRAP-type C4-dicarboxylate transport system permease small subunit
MTGIWNWLTRRAENVAALLMAVMFCSFIVQVAARYVFNNPVSWADELSVISGIWVILWSTALVTRETDNIRFDMIYGLVSPGMRRVFDAVSSLAIVVIFAVGFPAAWNYVNFMKVESTAALHIRYDLVFSVYILFAVAMIVRHLRILWEALRGHNQPPAPDTPLETD